MNPSISNKTILVVDDEGTIRETLASFFEVLGCHAICAENGRIAFEILQTTKIDAVITDVRMPGGDGIELLKNAKSINASMPVVSLITAFADISLEDAYDVGADAVLSKPFDLDVLERTVVRGLTPPEQRWQNPPEVESAGRRKGQFSGVYDDFEGALHEGVLALGRGGMFIASDQSLPSVGERIELDLMFKNRNLNRINGIGIVRWNRKTAAPALRSGIGVEFMFLEEDSLVAITGRIRHAPSVAFIPKGLDQQRPEILARSYGKPAPNRFRDS